jgi:hypothetical protein
MTTIGSTSTMSSTRRPDNDGEPSEQMVRINPIPRHQRCSPASARATGLALLAEYGRGTVRSMLDRHG